MTNQGDSSFSMFAIQASVVRKKMNSRYLLTLSLMTIRT